MYAWGLQTFKEIVTDHCVISFKSMLYYYFIMYWFFIT